MAFTFTDFTKIISPIGLINSLGNNANKTMTTAGSTLSSTVGSISSSLTLPLMIGGGCLLLVFLMK